MRYYNNCNGCERCIGSSCRNWRDHDEPEEYVKEYDPADDELWEREHGGDEWEDDD